MSCSPHPTKNSRFAEVSRLGRRFFCCVLLTICGFVFVHAAVLEPFHVPSGSMAPALYGHHRVCVCPRCGQEVAVGRANADAKGQGEPRFYRKAFCTNCGLFPLPLSEVRETPGDKISVNKTAYWTRSPSRWDIVVFRLLGSNYIKRLLGLPGEELLIHDGDVYADGRLLRKSYAEARALRVLMFDQERAPAEGWGTRWEKDVSDGGAPLPPAPIPHVVVDGRTTPCVRTYRNYSLDARKCEPLVDEYAYNGGLHADSECVHDFWIDTEIETTAGQGSLALRLCDGHDWIEVLLPIGESRAIELFAWPIDRAEQTRKLSETDKPAILRVNQRYRVELAFVDRRVTLAVDGRVWLSSDLPEAKIRQGVERPFQVQAAGMRAVLHRFRLYRDVHYGQQGTNGVHGKSVRLGQDQYFMLGDNSPNSEDSRYWSGEGRVDGASFVGPVLSNFHR